MPDFTIDTGPINVGGRKLDARKAGVFGGNLGMRINQAAHFILNPTVTPEKAATNAAPVGVGPAILLAVRNPRKLLTKLFFDARQLNPTGADSPIPKKPNVMPMWAADP